MNSEKKQNIILGMMIFLFVIFIAIIVAWALGYISINKSNVTSSENAETKNVMSNEATNNTNKTQVEIKEVEKGVFVPFDGSKCKNPVESDTVYTPVASNLLGIHAECINGEVYMYKSFDSTFTEEQFVSYIGNINMPEYGSKKKVEGFDKEVVDVLVPRTGNGIYYPLVLFLMEDGTVEYMKSGECISSGNLKTAGKVEGLSNIVRLVEISRYGNNGGGYSAAAITADGDFYDIMNILSYDILYAN